MNTPPTVRFPHRRSAGSPPGRRSALRPLIAFLLAAAALAAAPSPARAGTYVLLGCADLAGALGPGHVVRPVDGWFLEQGVYPSGNHCASGRSGTGLFATSGTGPNVFRLNAPPATSISHLVMTYRVHLSGAESWAVPTFVVEAGHGGSWETVPPALGHIGGGPIDFGGDRTAADAHEADAMRIGVRCEL